MLPFHRRRVVPIVAYDVAGAHRGQDQEFEGVGGVSSAGVKLGHERRAARVRQCRVVFDVARILLRAGSRWSRWSRHRAGLSPLRYPRMVAQPSTDFDPATQPARRLRFRRPDRLDHAHHQRHIDVPHRQSAKHRRGVSPERVLPLLPMLRVAPSRLVRLQVCVDASVERQRLSGLELSLRALGLTGGDRIDVSVQEFAAFQGAGPRLVDAHHVDRTETPCSGSGRLACSGTATTCCRRRPADTAHRRPHSARHGARG